jgi:signal transduction histidine kinase
MRTRTAARLAWAVWGLTLLLLLAWPVPAQAAHTQETGPLGYLFIPAAVLGFATVGALITSRQPGNRIGWILSLMAFSAALGLSTGAYASYSVVRHASLPFEGLAGWIARASFPLFIPPLSLFFLLFPDGHVPGPRWRWLLRLLFATIAVVVVTFALTPGDLSCCFIYAHLTNPLGLPLAWKGTVNAVTTVAGMLVFGCAFLGAVGLILRFRRSRRDERQQIKWLAFVAATAAAIALVFVLIDVTRAALHIHVADDDIIDNVFFLVLTLLLFLGVPAASAIAILRYRLYDLDIVVKKTVVFAVLALFISALYLALLVVLGGVVARSREATVAFVVGAIAAFAFQPVRRFARRVADRVVYGRRATPYEVLAVFSENMAGTYSTDDVLPRMAQILAQGTGAERAAVWLHVGRELVPAAEWPPHRGAVAPLRRVSEELPHFEGFDRAFPVRHQGEMLGALTLAMPPNDPMNPQKERVAVDLAAQGGLVLRNVRLIEELRASRQRLVAAQDEERRRLERNLHDGAQQQLVALSVKLGMAEKLIRDDEQARQLIEQIRAEATDALETLRDLARGIYPPLLADRGLTEALDAQLRKSAVPIELEADGIARYRQDVEAAVYFCVLEALQNVAKYANASRATVRLADGSGDLVFEVDDDGVGFDPERAGRGTGLQGMADRLEALGGTLDVRSAPGSGTVLVGRVPTAGNEGS